MVSKPIPILLLLLFITTIKSSSGINITAVMEKYPDECHFNLDFMGQAHAVEPISQLDAVTVLVLPDDGGVEQFVQNKLDGNGTVRAIHTLIIPEYVDVNSATDKPVTYATFFRTILHAPGKMGYVTMQKRPSDGKVVFGSAVPGAPMNSELIKTVVAQPPKVAVYLVSTLIVAPGLQKLPLPGQPGSTDPPSSSPSTATPSSDADTTSSAMSPSTTASAKVAPMAGVVRDTVAPMSSSAASSPKASESTASTAPMASESTAPMASGPGAGGPTTMVDGPSSADGPGPSAASGAGRVAFGAGVGMGIVGAVMLSL